MIWKWYYLVFVPEYADTDGFSIFTHSWTVGVELKFYLLFPPAVFLITKDANWRFAATAMVAALFTAQGSFIAEAYCAVLFGAMMALALERPRAYAFIARLTRVPAVVPLALIAGLFALLRYSEQFTALAAAATYMLAYTILQESAVSRVLTWRPLAYLGQRSYGAYLLHFLALRIGYVMFGNDSTTAGLLAGCVCLGLSVPAAELLYRTIEEPGRNYGRPVLSRKSFVSASLRDPWALLRRWFATASRGVIDKSNRAKKSSGPSNLPTPARNL
jgi:peptidoglycan/LPS O-acetylase OafA/YrhL